MLFFFGGYVFWPLYGKCHHNLCITSCLFTRIQRLAPPHPVRGGVGSVIIMKKLSLFLLFTILLILVAGLFIYKNPTHLLSISPKTLRSSAFTCSICGSTKYVDTKYFLGYFPIKSIEHIGYRAPGFSSCNHLWRPGIRSAYPDPVPDGNVVLVRKGGKYGAFVLYKQKTEPERAEYEWWYQSDGSGNLDKSLRTVSTGRGETPKIKFFDFEISWSANTDGKGWIYYKHFPGDEARKDDLHFCVTNLKSVEGINASDSIWKYKATPVD